ncbi:MAG: DNA/RNA helicase, superfamily II [Parcubacteria group bacterium GW2011_GWF2_42_7]|nr:MAG: DNA/RNA helicase, superfamily II [Parcubacteria group bacterium GW2011_GWA2_40_37]KKS11761.1 MAG: DNA/RNA helicase, superfamily II [Parcubacteria group bacterium GW2011_GWB1_41_5]KKS72271.1 MAG: DNA/RNA helicase, superfamily II [Parcubacteria group bacterium GW2011_GWF2_42_7]
MNKMYKPHSAAPSKFGCRPSSFKGRPRFPNKNKSRSRGQRGERIDFSRFIKRGTHVEEAPYVSKHTFADFPFNPQLHKNIKGAGFVSPRPIQDQAIPTVLAGKDVFGMANTGTGKTAAFLLPLIEKIAKTKGLAKRETVLIMAPTRELALQIESDFKTLAFGFGMFSVACVGGLPIMKQIREIKLGVSFVIGTPGRLRDLIEKKVLDLSTCHSVVLDEADRMLDMGFRDDMVYIIGKTNKERQTLFFSATLSPDIKKLTEQYLKDPIFISVITGETLKNINQNVIRARSKEEKLSKLHEILKKDGSDKVLIFREMKHSVDSLAKELHAFGFKVGGIHGDKRSRERIRILDSFKKDHINILIATDVAARGLDIPDVTHVINYDVPQTYDTYVHRIGRTGRSGKKGTALTFVPA